jgi:hypothetical protein
VTQHDEHRPIACHYDRALRQRVTRRHADDCPARTGALDPCPGNDGCEPCTHDHCVVCGREHSTTATPMTCPECQGKVDEDLVEILAAYAALAQEAMFGGSDGRLVAAAPIPGGEAQVLIGPYVKLPLVRMSRTTREDHRRGDPLPPLAVLAQWEDGYRAYLGHDHQPEPTREARWGDLVTAPRRATLGGSIKYLRDQLPYIAQRSDGPDFLAFTRQVRRLRADLEEVLHDERQPERGVECFACGDQLVRRFRPAKHCQHPTPAREQLRAWLLERQDAQDHLRTLATYPELGGPRVDEVVAAAPPPAQLVAAARQPCEPCAAQPGGIDDPRAGRSWECPGCRKEYTPGEYANAVRTSLVDDRDGSGWCTVVAAADAAADISGRPVSPAMIRVWIGRGDDIPVACWWKQHARSGVQLVHWPSVLRRACEVRTTSRSARGGRISA